MNKARRKQIEAVKARIGQLLQLAENIREDVEAIRDAEQDFRDNMPESIADGEKGERADAAIEALDEVIDNLEGIGELEFESLLDSAAE
jgi:prefoldin subunit 5